MIDRHVRSEYTSCGKFKEKIYEKETRESEQGGLRRQRFTFWMMYILRNLTIELQSKMTPQDFAVFFFGSLQQSYKKSVKIFYFATIDFIMTFQSSLKKKFPSAFFFCCCKTSIVCESKDVYIKRTYYT